MKVPFKRLILGPKSYFGVTPVRSVHVVPEGSIETLCGHTPRTVSDEVHRSALWVPMSNRGKCKVAPCETCANALKGLDDDLDR